MKAFLSFILMVCCLPLVAQDSLASFPITVQRVRAFGQRIPQEKVYVHMDNRCYFQGDTIWFKAYTQQTNDGRPSELSGTLYAELLDQEGYLKERKLVEMKHGQGHGFFATDSTMHGGFYELRAYTRWQLPQEDEYPEYYVRLAFPYPRFVKPFNYYQTALCMDDWLDDDVFSVPVLGRQLQEITVKGRRRSGLSKRMYQQPAVVLDAYEAFNLVSDAGLMDGWYTSSDNLGLCIARFFSSDMGLQENYRVVTQLGGQLDLQTGLFQIDGQNPDKARKLYNNLCNLDKVYVYSGYSPRQEGDKRYHGANTPVVRVQITRRKLDESRATFRDRYMPLPGYSYLAECYQPDYSTRRPSPDEGDYRRTLYWNPDLKLDKDGRAQVKFYNNARTTQLCIEAAGLAEDGTILWNQRE